MPFTSLRLSQNLPNGSKQTCIFASALHLAMERFQINSRLWMAPFISLGC
ncbi:hypothetical protein SB725_16050 [Pseudomonas sp. SIMBA_041]